MRDRVLSFGVAVIALLVVTTACGSGEQSGGDPVAVAADQPTEASTDSDAEQSSGTEQDESAVTSVEADSTDENDSQSVSTDDGATVENPLPTSADPCREPADFSALEDRLTGDGYITSFRAAGESRSLTVRFSSADAATADDAVIVVMFHGAGGSNDWSRTMWNNSFLPELAQQRPVVTVMAQAVDGRAGLWPSDTYLGTEYPEALTATLAQSFCLRQMPIVLHGHGQGTIVALNGYCTGSIPTDALVFVMGMAKLLDCPADPTPVVTLDIYEFQPVVGHHWGGAWNPPVAEIVEMTGGIQSTPDDLDHWAAQFGCESEPTENLLPIDTDSNEDVQPITVLAVRDCVEPIVAIGAPALATPRPASPFWIGSGVLDVVN